jgi:hypothetical protein
VKYQEVSMVESGENRHFHIGGVSEPGSKLADTLRRNELIGARRHDLHGESDILRTHTGKPLSSANMMHHLLKKREINVRKPIPCEHPSRLGRSKFRSANDSSKEGGSRPCSRHCN